MEEMAPIETILGIIPAKANHYKVSRALSGKGRFFKDEIIRRYEQSFAEQCRVYKNRCIDGPFRLNVKVFFPKISCDLDNAMKTLLDCLEYVHAIKNDSLCFKIVAVKAIDPYNPRIMFNIEEMNEQKKLF